MPVLLTDGVVGALLFSPACATPGARESDSPWLSCTGGALQAEKPSLAPIGLWKPWHARGKTSHDPGQIHFVLDRTGNGPFESRQPVSDALRSASRVLNDSEQFEKILAFSDLFLLADPASSLAMTFSTPRFFRHALGAGSDASVSPMPRASTYTGCNSASSRFAAARRAEPDSLRMRPEARE